MRDRYDRQFYYKKKRRRRNRRNGLAAMLLILLFGTVLIVILVSLPKKDGLLTASSAGDLSDESAENPANPADGPAELESEPPVNSSNPQTHSSKSAGASSQTASKQSAGSSKPAEQPADFGSKPPQSELSQWYLKLFNPQNPLLKTYVPSLADIRKEYVADNGKKFDAKQFSAQAIDALHAMFDAAKADGIRLFSISSYRSYGTQEGIFNNKVNILMSENKNLTRSEAEAEAATVNARPGTSEHQSGLAVDINSLSESFENTSAFLWLSNHAADYGFILRYPKDKKSITGIIYEPWHYRYVTAAHAKMMVGLGMCLEEYIQYLSE